MVIFSFGLMRKLLIFCCFVFCLAYAAVKHEVEIHGYVFLSNHVHIVATDTKGDLPLFLRDFLGISAFWFSAFALQLPATTAFRQARTRLLNKKLGKKENIWSNNKAGTMKLVTKHDVLSRMEYTIVNPVVAGLVPIHKDWPGGISTIHDIGYKTIRLKRSKYFFVGSVVLGICFAIACHSCVFLQENAMVNFKKRINQMVSDKERDIRKERGDKPFLGIENSLKSSIWAHPKNYLEKNKLNPKIACSDPEQRLREIQAIIRKRY